MHFCLSLGNFYLNALRLLLLMVHRSSVDGVTGVSQGSVLGPLLFLVYTSELFSLVSNTLVEYADDTTLLGIVPRPSDHTSFKNSLNRLRHGKNNTGVITGCRFNRLTNLTNHRTAWHLKHKGFTLQAALWLVNLCEECKRGGVCSSL